ncbi:ATP-grasp domain-containing protein [uncultured Bacteroides sp.]|uniref:ATP-grasp domain-containing protein n=1 Tax=uncultured Bacteroides sp. TaxID=162156 RepID=UPI0026286750|nr:ATP-grasp domain-containing protein [uncultured Bacteroides sp.]
MGYKGKKLLVQGAGRGHLGLIQAAKEMGIYTIVTGMPGNYPCTPLADKICYADIKDKQAVLRIAQDEGVDGIVICCSDTGLQTVGYVCDQMNLSGISENSAVLCADKSLMKDRLMKSKVRTAKYMRIYQEVDIQECIDTLRFPMIVKAVDLQGSRGIYIVKNVEELAVNFRKVMNDTAKDHCIVEEFIEGNEFGAQAFVYNGEILFVLPHGDQTIMCQTAVPIGHYMPLEMNEEILEDVQEQAEKAIRALKLDNCAVNIDFIEKEGKAYIIELTGRVGANCLPELTSNYWGVNYYSMIIAMALGGNPKEIFEKRNTKPCCTMAKMLKSTQSGIVKQISHSANSPDCNAILFVTAGSEVRAFTNCNDAIGQIVVTADDYDTCCEKIEEYVKNMHIIIN